MSLSYLSPLQLDLLSRAQIMARWSKASKLWIWGYPVVLRKEHVSLRLVNSNTYQIPQRLGKFRYVCIPIQEQTTPTIVKVYIRNKTPD